MAESKEGWVARAPHHRNVPEVDTFLSAATPWAIVHEADNVRLYRFEKGAFLAT